MQILFYTADRSSLDNWMQMLRAALPDAEVRSWEPGDDAPADYALVWNPPAALLQAPRGLKAVFNLGAGVDAILAQSALPPDLPLIRIEDGAMAIQMAEYATYGVMHYFRQFDRYAQQGRDGRWQPLPPRDKSSFRIGILGLGVLGTRIASALTHFDFPVQGWSRGPKQLAHVDTHHGADGLTQLLKTSNVLISILPLTDETRGLLNRDTLGQLPPQSYLINVGRGAHVDERDLLALIRSGHLAGAMLDVFGQEPLPPQHAFWKEPRITITPHISAITVRAESVEQIRSKIGALERNEKVAGVVDRDKGY
ncbi:MAG: glyoxylate/hydroxypyruvate reductase [Herbaspirillum sp.]|jgi:glyoxylate/hydroxypyruvate reductase A|nr:glyoxylate/hydroxypyruvate reductase [Herbaspirillum sp.]